MTLRAQSSMFWPGISKQIAEYIHSCAPCQTISNLQQKELAIPMEVPYRPWKVLGMDFLMHKSKWYLLVADYYSKFPYILQMSSMTSKNVISAVSFCFSVLGTPEKIICDNATNFTSIDYNECATNWGFILTTSNPHYPKGMASLKGRCRPSRRCLPGVMKIITTNIWLSKSFKQPQSTAIYSHQQTFSSADTLKTTFPAIIRPPHNSEAVRASLKARQDYSRYNAHSKEKPNLLPTQPIWVQDAISKR